MSAEAEAMSGLVHDWGDTWNGRDRGLLDDMFMVKCRRCRVALDADDRATLEAKMDEQEALGVCVKPKPTVAFLNMGDGRCRTLVIP